MEFRVLGLYGAFPKLGIRFGVPITRIIIGLGSIGVHLFWETTIYRKGH